MEGIKNWVWAQYGLMRRFYREDFASLLRTTAIAFAVITCLSFVFALLARNTAASLVERFSVYVQELGISEDGSISASAILGNNLRVAGASILYGFIPFLYLPALTLGTNALMLGVMGGYCVNSGYSLLTYLAGVLPHGLFELPALVLALALGLYLCEVVVDYMRKNTRGIVLAALKNIARVFLFWIVPLLIVASVIEAYITPLVLRLFM